PAPPPAASPPPPAASPPPLPAGAGLEQDLLYQLGRAASQGLVDAELPAAPAGAARAPEDPAVPAAPETDAGATPPLSAGAGRAIRATTVFDRDLAPPEAPADQTPEGDPCTPTGALDVPAWGDDRPATTQLAEARAALVGEFDRPDPAAVLAYARLLVFLGFGAEARQVLDAFDAGGEEADTLRALARAVDGTDGPAPGLLRGQAACEGPAALWALLDPVPPGPGEPVAHGAAIRAFSALPGHLRRAVGPRLTEVFLARGESDAARAVQDAIDRALTAEDGPAALDDATFAALSGDDGRALALLAEIARENGEDAPEAVARGLELRLERGLPVPPDEAATAAAFAWEYRATPVGPRLAAAAIAATAAAGDPGAAFDLLAEWRAALPEGLRRAAEERILDEIAGLEDPDAFLTAWFAHQDAIAAADPSAGLRRKLSGRLVGAGLPGAAAALLDTAPEATAEWRLARARAALAVGEPDLALDLTAGLDLPGVADLRADALTATGDLAAAAGVALDAGSSRADRAAWRAAAGRAGAGPEMLERSLRMLGAAPPPPAPPPPAAPGGPAGGPAGQSPAPGPGGATGQGGTTGPIGQGRALLAASAATRESLRALLAAAGAGAPPAAAP
ncbi:MAG: hypothetical protein N2422_13015, partial [Rhodobacteraceae bacterium]|nr:hypothetical protein [Paracoccaceae bacterium]